MGKLRILGQTLINLLKVLDYFQQLTERAVSLSAFELYTLLLPGPEVCWGNPIVPPASKDAYRVQAISS